MPTPHPFVSGGTRHEGGWGFDGIYNEKVYLDRLETVSVALANKTFLLDLEFGLLDPTRIGSQRCLYY